MVPTSASRSASAALASVAIAAACPAAVAASDIAVVEADAQTATFVGEATYQVSLRQVARRFYASQDDRFDTLIVFPAFATTAADGALYEAVMERIG